jgi:DNA-binding MarR family transcriptional regulator
VDTASQWRTTLDKLLEVAVLVNTDLRRDLARRGLTEARVHLLWVLGLRGSTTQRDLADALRVTPRNVTGLVDALVDTGFVVRRPHPTDRRATLVELTRKGRSTTRDLQQGHGEFAELLFGDLPTRQFGCFDKGLDAVLERLRAAVLDDEEATVRD